jgi:integrase/recombinase XerD
MCNEIQSNIMFKFNSNGISLNLTRDVRNFTRNKRVLLNTDECPLKWCVTYQRKQVYYSTGINLNEADWIALNGGDGKGKTTIKQYRETLQKYYDSTIQKNVKDLAENGTFSFELLNVRLGKSVGTDLKNTFRAKIQNLIADDKIGNAKVYQCVLRSIEIYNPKDIPFSDITPKWLDKYQKYMEAKGLRYSTIGMYLRTLRAIMNDAKDNDIINATTYPFGDKKKGKFEIPIGEGRELSMEIADIKRVAEYDCPTKTIEMCRDLWIFSYLCNGVNFGDMLRFKYSDIKDNEIYFYRKKTKETTKKKIEIIAPILPEMQLIIDKWGNPHSAKGFIFPFLNGTSTEIEYKAQIHNVIRLTNKHIKSVTKALELPDISTYNCRHSYTTILAKLRTPESYIDQATGHSQGKSVTKGYIGKYTKQERINYNSLLLWK